VPWAYTLYLRQPFKCQVSLATGRVDLSHAQLCLLLVDDHGTEVPEPVWQGYEQLLAAWASKAAQATAGT